MTVPGTAGTSFASPLPIQDPCNTIANNPGSGASPSAVPRRSKPLALRRPSTGNAAWIAKRRSAHESSAELNCRQKCAICNGGDWLGTATGQFRRFQRDTAGPTDLLRLFSLAAAFLNDSGSAADTRLSIGLVRVTKAESCPQLAAEPIRHVP